MILFLFFSFFCLAAAVEKKQYCYEGQRRLINEQTLSTSYLRCEQGVWVQKFCPPQYVVDPQTVTCIFSPGRPPFTFPPTRPTSLPQICIPGSRQVDLFDNTKYRECSWDGRAWIIRYCQPNSVFNPNTFICEYLNVSTNRPTWTPTYAPTTTTTPFYGPCTESGGPSGYKPDIYSCFNFYQCASGRWIQKACPAGTVWNQSILTCDHNNGQCRPFSQQSTQPPRTTTVIEVKKH